MENARGVRSRIAREPLAIHRAWNWLKYLSAGRHCFGRAIHGAGQFREYLLYISAAPKNCFVAGLMQRALHIAELSGKSNRQLGKYPARAVARRTARPCVHVRAPYYPSLLLPSVLIQKFLSRGSMDFECSATETFD